MTDPIKITLSTLEDTKRLAKALSLAIREGDCIGLDGELGAGKTTFVKFAVAALGSGDSVSSPSFVLQNIYSTPEGLEIEHWDLYRVSEAPLDLLSPPPLGAFRFVEWASKCPGVDYCLRLEFAFPKEYDNIGDVTEREVSIWGEKAGDIRKFFR